MKRFATLILSLAVASMLCACLAACGSNSNTGKYMGTTVTYLGIETPIQDVFPNGENMFELRSGAKCELTLEGQKISGTYSVDNGQIHIHLVDAVNSMDCPGTIGDGKVTIDFTGMDLHFEK